MDPRIARYYDFTGRLFLSKGDPNDAVAELPKPSHWIRGTPCIIGSER
jgi:hypothetical protein